MRSPHIAVMASGEGTTAEAVAEAWAKKKWAPRIGLIITNNPNAGILKRFPGVAYTIVDPEDEDTLIKKLGSVKYDLIWLAGYMKKVGPKVVERFGWRADTKSPYEAMMVNTHPGLLPATKGLYGIHVQEYVLKHGLPAGHTLHVVSSEYDDGPTIAEHRVPIEPGDTPESLFERVRASERKHLPADIEEFIHQRRKFWDKYVELQKRDEA